LKSPQFGVRPRGPLFALVILELKEAKVSIAKIEMRYKVGRFLIAITFFVAFNAFAQQRQVQTISLPITFVETGLAYDPSFVPQTCRVEIAPALNGGTQITGKLLDAVGESRIFASEIVTTPIKVGILNAGTSEITFDGSILRDHWHISDRDFDSVFEFSVDANLSTISRISGKGVEKNKTLYNFVCGGERTSNN
jgi:hypothetical protein